ncbi:hypothetical protein [Photobacterium kishitanii]|uniref:Uncharacterized protein n=1 Tax=Photobacterium kishitanii TaxID=318456 RepID=A0A2T3KL47_9GAMM|nr:hypothetical protein [Photobacterium kishitanii]PSV00432.1 hypothetical protein C9J27_04690 [Photobacterium kishitanii]
MNSAFDTRKLTNTVLASANFGTYIFEDCSGAESSDFGDVINISFPLFFKNQDNEAQALSSRMEISVNLTKKLISIENGLTENIPELLEIAYSVVFPELETSAYCKKCGCETTHGFCSDETCIFNSYPQHAEFNASGDTWTPIAHSKPEAPQSELTVEDLLKSLKSADPKAILQVRGTIVGEDGEDEYLILSPTGVDINGGTVILDF